MTTLQDIALSKLNRHPRNPRDEVGDVTELAASIREKGVIEPLIVVPKGPSTFLVLAGHRRLAAATLAKVETVPCIVREDLAGDEAAQLETMLVENLQRTDLTPIEEAKGYQDLLDFNGYTIARITKATGRSTPTVKSRLKLMRLPAKARDALHAGQVTLHDALAVTEFAGDKATAAALTKALGTHDFPYQLQAAKNTRDKNRHAANSAKQLQAEAAAGTITKVLDGAPPYGEDVLRIPGGRVDLHADCGPILGWVNFRGDAEYGCSKPHTCVDSRQAAADALFGRTGDAAVDHARAEAQELRDQLDTAAAVRRKHLCDYIVDGTRDPLAHEILLRLASYAASTAPAFSCQLLELEYTGTPDAVRTMLTAGLSHLNVHQLAIALDVLLNAAVDGDLEIPTGWGGQYGDSPKTWRHRLATVYGYEWSQVELDQLAKYPDAQTPPTAEQSAEADVYEHGDLRDAVEEQQT